MKRKADKPLDGKKPLKKKSKNGLSDYLANLTYIC
jgi:hypothetical protein